MTLLKVIQRIGVLISSFFCLSFTVSKEEIDMLQADHDQVGQDLYDTKQRLLDQLDANHVLTELKYSGNTGVKMMDQAVF